jgi:hypothetical protein
MKGFFIDWDGNVRRFENPGDGYRCEIEDDTVIVLESDGGVAYTATFYPTIYAIEALGIEVCLVDSVFNRK